MRRSWKTRLRLRRASGYKRVPLAARALDMIAGRARGARFDMLDHHGGTSDTTADMEAS